MFHVKLFHIDAYPELRLTVRIVWGGIRPLFFPETFYRISADTKYVKVSVRVRETIT